MMQIENYIYGGAYYSQNQYLHPFLSMPPLSLPSSLLAFSTIQQYRLLNIRLLLALHCIYGTDNGSSTLPSTISDG